MRKCLIVGASNLYSYQPVPQRDTFVIGVDGGYRTLQKLGIEADQIVGDFDSMEISEDEMKAIKDKTIVLNKEKDDTDTLFALRVGLKKGYDEFHLFGCTGGRVSHSFANIQCLAFLAEKNARNYLYGRDYIMTCISNGSIEFDESYKGYISVFSHSDTAKNVRIDGLKYELKDAELNNRYPIGVSNEFIGKKSKISVGEGVLTIVYPKKKRRIEI